VVRRAHRPQAQRRRRLVAGLAQALQRRAGQRLVQRQRRQQAGKALRQHALAGARRADQQQAVAARGGDFQRAFGSRLAAHVAQVGCRLGRC
jgi:hypothetical protein